MEYIVNLIIYMEKSGLILSRNDGPTVPYTPALLSLQMRSVHVCYLVCIKFHPTADMLLWQLVCLPARPATGAKLHRTRTPLRENGACVGAWGSFLGRGARCLLLQSQAATQGAWPSASSAMVASKLLGEITSSNSMLKDMYICLGDTFP